MPQSNDHVLTLNGGSSSIRFAIYDNGKSLSRRLTGKIDRIGSGRMTLAVRDLTTGKEVLRRLPAGGHVAAVEILVGWLETQPSFRTVSAVGHRVVHGMKHSQPQRITPKLLSELRESTPYVPDHLPPEIELMQAMGRRHPKLPQVACFDTAFHRSMPTVAKLLPLPGRYRAEGMERYGFHGLSYSYVMEELARLDPRAAKGRVILAHLGGGASLAAVRNGKSIDTSMGFTPTSGLVMGTRSGDVDPGVLFYLARTKKMTAVQIQKLLNHESGLFGVSGGHSDMRDLLKREKTDAHAADAVSLFCYQAKKWIGSYAAALGGLDTLIFTGGIGENATVIRDRICAGLDFLGIELSASRNASSAGLISTGASRATVRVIHTDEELMIARSVIRTLKKRLVG